MTPSQGRKPAGAHLASGKPKKKRKRFSDLIRVLLLLLSIAVFSFSAYEILITVFSYREGRAFYSGTAEKYVRPSEETPQTPKKPVGFEAVPWSGGSESTADADSPLGILMQTEAPISVDFEELLAENSDVVAWVYSPDTVINYPVVQAEDNDYYLHRRLDRNYSTNGTVFMDYRCNSDFTSDNSVIYGHNMKDGSMFHSLKEYADAGYFAAHPIVYLLTPERNYAIRIFYSGIVGSTSWPYDTRFSDDAERRSFLSQAARTSDITADFEPEAGERFVTLSTCSYEFNDARYVVIGTLVPIK